MHVPEGWKYKQLEELGARDRPAVKAGPFGSSVKKEFYVPSGYKIYGQEQVIANDPFFGNYYIDEEKYISLKSCAVIPGDILLSLVGTVGKVLVIPENAEPGIINPRLLRISIDHNKVSFCFLKYFLEDTKTKNKLENWAQGGTMGVLNAEMLKSLPIPIPPFSEQQKIAQILSTWDKGIEKLEALIAAKQKRKKALMQQLLTGKKRFSGFEGEWKRNVLEQIAEIVMGSSPKSEAYNEIGDGLPLLQGNADIKNRLSAPRIYTSQITKICSPNDILLSVRAPVGAIARSLHKACIGRGIASVKAKKGFSQNFLYQWMLYFEPKWDRLSQGSTFESVNSADIKNLHIFLPNNLEEQEKIASVLSAADKEIETHQKQLSALKQQKKSLMQQLLTGKKRVKIDEPEQRVAVGA